MDLVKIESAIRKVLAIEMLEYEDKNLLHHDNKTNSEIKMTLLEEVLNDITKG